MNVVKVPFTDYAYAKPNNSYYWTMRFHLYKGSSHLFIRNFFFKSNRIALIDFQNIYRKTNE